MAGQPGRSGGRRRGKPGGKYPNRSDLRSGPPTQTPQATSNQTYGERGAQLQSQAAMPLSRQAAPVAGSSPATSAPASAGGGGPQVIPSLTAPTSRPNEPLTAGLVSGAGPGPEAIRQQSDPTLAMLQGAYSKYPNADLLALIQEAQNR